MYRIGIDVGGTHTDAVILDTESRIVSEVKVPTTTNVSEGICNAIRQVMDRNKTVASEVEYVMIGTTHCTNAIVQRKNLNRVGIIRLGAPATTAIRPMTAVPSDLVEVLNAKVAVLPGGHEFNGSEISELDEEVIVQTVRSMSSSVDSFAICSVFSPVNQDHELRVRSIIAEVLGDDTPVSLSCEIGSLGLLERENATILNAAINRVANEMVDGLMDAIRGEKIEATVFFGQNDGTLMGIDFVRQYPIFTIASGPTNSIRGAVFLAGLSDCVVVDVGGTTTDIGVVKGSFPRESAVAAEIGGVRTNFRMPDLVSIGIGGGTIVHMSGDAFTIGPDSVGHELTSKGFVFGGDTLTLTDVAVCLGICEIGDPEKVKHLDRALMQRVYDKVVEMVEDGIDRIKTSGDPLPVVLVGGGSILLPETLQGATQVVRPENFGVANAFGAASGHLSSQIDKVYSYVSQGRDEVLSTAKNSVVTQLISEGVVPESIDFIEVEDTPLAYMGNDSVRVRIKAAGTLAVH